MSEHYWTRSPLISFVLTMALLVSISLAAAAGLTKDLMPFQRAAIAAQAPNARLAILVQNGGAILRNKGAASVNHVGIGKYCITPQVAFDVGKAIVVATVDWSHSLPGSDADLVQWRSSGADCNRSALEILTFRNSGNGFVATDAVAFSLIVP